MGPAVIYCALALFGWTKAFGEQLPSTFDEGYAVLGGGVILATLAPAVAAPEGV